MPSSNRHRPCIAHVYTTSVTTYLYVSLSKWHSLSTDTLNNWHCQRFTSVMFSVLILHRKIADACSLFCFYNSIYCDQYYTAAIILLRVAPVGRILVFIYSHINNQSIHNFLFFMAIASLTDFLSGEHPHPPDNPDCRPHL